MFLHQGSCVVWVSFLVKHSGCMSIEYGVIYHFIKRGQPDLAGGLVEFSLALER